jgi:predicted DNA-binding ribbon-helix-helix protein
MRTTLSIHDPLLRQAKEISLQRNISVSQVVEEALQSAFGKKAHKSRASALRFKTFRGDGLQPGVNLSSSSGLLDVMEGH